MTREPILFGVRHLSPAGAWNLRKLLDERRPRVVLIEGPSDLTDQLADLTRADSRPPLAVLAYTQEIPVRTLLYPLAEYSPEYQAALWARANGAECRFIDLPSSVFLALPSSRPSGDSEDGEERFDVYGELDRLAGEDGHETFWERTLEHTSAAGAYHEGANRFGAELRALTAGREDDWAENLMRESYMRRNIDDAINSGTAPEDVAVVTGAYHVEGLKTAAAMSDEEIASLPRAESHLTLMPYSYYRLSSRSGYGAGNRAPSYYGLIWDSLCAGRPSQAVRAYLSRIARYQRELGFPVSSAEVIEAVRLASELARLRGSRVPALRDVRDAAVTCLGHGSLAEISRAVADTEIGTVIGSLPDGVSRTSIQQDFYRRLSSLKLEKYRDLSAQELSLDLREDRSVKNERAAFLDLERSYFLHCLRVLGVSFVKQADARQDGATWAERWVLSWTPEAEIELVEAALKGDTVVQAASFCLKERTGEAPGIGAIASVIEDAFTCGMSSAVTYATAALQALAVDAVAIDELALTAHRLSYLIQYGTVRRLDPKPLEPILRQLFFRACLTLPSSCVCDDNGSSAVIEAIGQLNAASLAHDTLDGETWLNALREIARRDDLNTRCSGFAAAVLLERGAMSNEELSIEVQRRLSRGVPADLGALWFEGLALKNRYALIARLPLWQSLNDYLDTLDDEEFKRALVFLRRAFADFSAKEKSDVAENLGELWQLNPQGVSEAVTGKLDADSQKIVDSLGDFDFDDI